MEKEIFFVLEHPEDLGATKRWGPHSRPASIWQLLPVQNWVRSGRVFSGAFFQCHLGAKSQKPTRLLYNLPSLTSGLWMGLPTFTPAFAYSGPLPRSCRCSRSHVSLIRRLPNDQFATAGAAAYPPAMDFWLARHLFDSFLKRGTKRTYQEVDGDHGHEPPGAPSVGVSEGHLHGVPEGHPADVSQGRERAKGVEGRKPSMESSAEVPGGHHHGVSQGQGQAEGDGDVPEVHRGGSPRRRERRAGELSSPSLWTPLQVWYKGKARRVVDGLGINSPGIRPVGHRGQALGKEAAVLAGVFWQAVDGFMEGLGKKGLLKLVSELALGRHVESPFQAVMHDLRHRLDGCLKKLGQDPSRRKGDVKTEIAYRRLRAWAALVGDDDHQFLADMAATGVPLGVRSEIPWVSAVYDKKDRRSASDAAPGRWEEDVPGDPTLRDNYASAKDHMEKVKRHIAKDVEKGWMVKMSKEEATARYGEDLQVASLGAVPKDKDWSDVRVVHDATHGLQVNTQVDQPNQLAFPQFDDLEAVTKAFREQADPRRFLLAFGIKSAHRLVPIHPRDWGLQACRLDCEEEILVNTRGTFGVATAAFWWGRVAGLVFRVYHRLLPAEAIFYLLLFADDGLMFSSGQQYHRHLLGLFMFLEVMEIPLSWSKTRGGVRTEWIGYTVDLQQWKIGISEKKVQWLRSWTAGALAQGRMLGREFKAGLGRMGFLAGISKRARPFLAPMYAASAQVRGGSFFELHLATKLAIKFFEGTITSEPMRPLSTQPEVLGEIFRVDAMADNDGVAIGGWETYSSSDPKLARWFHVKLSRGSAPFLYVKGEPFRTISSSELLAVTVAIMVFAPEACWRNGSGRVAVTGFTDNLSNAYLIDRFLTTKFPASLVLMELAKQLDHYNLDLDLAWIPRNKMNPRTTCQKAGTRSLTRRREWRWCSTR